MEAVGRPDIKGPLAASLCVSLSRSERLVKSRIDFFRNLCAKVVAIDVAMIEVDTSCIVPKDSKSFFS